MMSISGRLVASVGLIVSVSLPVPAAAADPSAKAAGEVVALMTSRNLDTFAAPDPDGEGRFVAVMLIPGVQLLVVAAKSTAPAYVEAQLAQQLYREVYSTLQSAAVLETKVFFQDMGSDGLRADSNVDIMYEHGTRQTTFDGDWKRQKMSKSEYEDKLRTADVAYSRLLSLLTERLRAPVAAK
ncbi:MAG: hypothetical protein ABI818_18980 [Acidobacteriota bacterium]